MTTPTPKRRVTPDHLPDTTYPFFWVQPIRSRDCQVADSWDVGAGMGYHDVLYGLYRYDKPNASDGISFPTWVADFEILKTADAICSALNLVRDLHQMSASLPDLGGLHENLEIARTLLV